MSVDQSTANAQVHEIPVDYKLQEFTVSVSGPTPTIEIYTPTGKLYTVNMEILCEGNFLCLDCRQLSIDADNNILMTDNLNCIDITKISKTFTA